jgi:oligopeptide transport system substrate-binding protein
MTPEQFPEHAAAREKPLSDQRHPLEIVMVNGRQLTEKQLSRRRFNLGLLGAGAFAALAGVGRSGALAQDATPAAGAATPVPDYTGPLAAVQEIKLPTTEPTTMDPGVSYGDDELDIFYNIFDGLVGVDQKTGEVVPRVAESFSANADASEFTFKIRQGVTWSDGTPLNANDFVYSWKRIFDPELASQYIAALYPIKNAEKIATNGVSEGNGTAATPDPSITVDDLGVAATDDYTLVVTLEGSTPYFPLLATTWTFNPVPKHVVDAQGAKWVEAENIVSNGPYKMTGWNHDQNITLEINDKYYGDKPTITKATYTILNDTGADSYVPFQNNELDYCAPDGPSLETARADTSGDQTVISFERSNTYFIVCDTTNPPTDKVEFRQALSKSIDRETLSTNIFKGSYVPALSLLPNNIPGHNPDATLGENVDEAKQLLATAGIDPSSVELELTFINNEYYTTVTQYLQAGWQDKLGIKIKLNPIEDSAYSDWRAARETTPFNIYTATWGSDFADASNWFNQNFTHASDHYRNHWNFPDFDALVAKAVTNTNSDERIQEYSQAEAMIVEQAPIIPFLHGIAFRFVKPWVKDLHIQAITSVVHLRTIKIAQH